MMLLYLFALTRIRMTTWVCVVITHLTAITGKLSPINLAVMSVERYLAICFPLRHATIATPKTTGAAIFAMWSMASLESFTQLFLFIRLNNADLTTQGFCSTNTVFWLQVYMTLNRTFPIVNFVLVSVIIIYTYGAVMVSVKSSASFAHKAENAYKIVLLHIFQLFLYLYSV
nr:odorant receptor 131-2-like [Nothobranchius furzeri]